MNPIVLSVLFNAAASMGLMVDGGREVGKKTREETKVTKCRV
jgi:hypothetical protein